MVVVRVISGPGPCLSLLSRQNGMFVGKGGPTKLALDFLLDLCFIEL